MIKFFHVIRIKLEGGDTSEIKTMKLLTRRLCLKKIYVNIFVIYPDKFVERGLIILNADTSWRRMEQDLMESFIGALSNGKKRVDHRVIALVGFSVNRYFQTRGYTEERIPWKI